MPRRPEKYLFDVLRSARAIRSFCADKTYENYLADLMLRSAVERQFEIVGEALAQLRQVDSDLVDKIAASGQAIGLRNILIHGYAEVDDEIVWRTMQDDLPRLEKEIAALMPDEDPP